MTFTFMVVGLLFKMFPPKLLHSTARFV